MKKLLISILLTFAFGVNAAQWVSHNLLNVPALFVTNGIPITNLYSQVQNSGNTTTFSNIVGILYTNTFNQFATSSSPTFSTNFPGTTITTNWDVTQFFVDAPTWTDVLGSSQPFSTAGQSNRVFGVVVRVCNQFAAEAAAPGGGSNKVNIVLAPVFGDTLTDSRNWEDTTAGDCLTITCPTLGTSDLVTYTAISSSSVLATAKKIRVRYVYSVAVDKADNTAIIKDIRLVGFVP